MLAAQFSLTKRNIVLQRYALDVPGLQLPQCRTEKDSTAPALTERRAKVAQNENGTYDLLIFAFLLCSILRPQL